MSLLGLGPVIFGGTDAIIAFMRTHRLLASRQDCARCAARACSACCSCLQILLRIYPSRLERGVCFVHTDVRFQ